MVNESIEKRKALGLTGDHFACFMCSSPKHIAPYCKAYPQQKPTSKPGKCGLYHPEEICKSKRGASQPVGKVVRN